MSKTIMTATILLLYVLSVNGQPPQKKQTLANPEGVYHVEIKNVITNAEVVVAPVEVGGRRILNQKSGGFLFGDVAGIPNTEGAIRLDFDDYAVQPLTIQLHWSKQSLPQGQQMK